MESIGFTSCGCDVCRCVLRKASHLAAILIVQVDDCLMALNQGWRDAQEEASLSSLWSATYWPNGRGEFPEFEFLRGHVVRVVDPQARAVMIQTLQFDYIAEPRVRRTPAPIMQQGQQLSMVEIWGILFCMGFLQFLSSNIRSDFAAGVSLCQWEWFGVRDLTDLRAQMEYAQQIEEVELTLRGVQFPQIAIFYRNLFYANAPGLRTWVGVLIVAVDEQPFRGGTTCACRFQEFSHNPCRSGHFSWRTRRRGRCCGPRRPCCPPVIIGVV